MKIGLLGAGSIGSTLARRLATAGHDVKVANSRGPQTIDPDILTTGARAVTAEDAVRDVDVLILSIPLKAIPGIAGLISSVPDRTVVIDTSNYYPGRDGTIEAIDNGQAESEWVIDQLARPVVKAWNAVLSDIFATGDRPAGHSERIGIPIAGDDAHAKEVAAALMNDSGFDAVDAGSIADSWRQQPGSPVYCTALRADEIPPALEAAKRDRLPALRDLAGDVIMERAQHANIDGDFLLRLTRLFYM